jgi:predicted amidohydrolase
MSSTQKTEDLLQIVGIQSPIVWEDAEANRIAFTQRIEDLTKENEKIDIVVLPEVFTSGFSMNLDSIDSWESGVTLNWMRGLAKKYDIAITGSVAFRFEDGLARNRSLFVKPNGNFEFYDKRHLFTFGKEDEYYQKGEDRKIVEYRGWKILLQICYDLRFPCFARNSLSNRYDISLYVANWPEVRRHPWRTLLQARAMENQCYVMGVNRTGTDPNKIIYRGDSLGVDPYGKILSDAQDGESIMLVCNRTTLEEFRKKFPVLEDADSIT